MSLTLALNVQGLDRANRQLQALASADYDDLLAGLAAEVESQTRRRIQQEKTAPDGTPWAPLNPDYKARKRERSGGGILELEGDLRDSLESRVAGGEAVIAMGINLPYAAIHQLGGEAVGMPWIDARPYMGVSDDNLDDLQALIDDWTNQLLEH